MSAPLRYALLVVGLFAVLFVVRSSSNRLRPDLERALDGRTLPGDVPLSLPGALTTARESSGAARASVVLNAESGSVLFAHNAFTPLPIASLTKIMSAIVVLDTASSLDRDATILPAEYSVRGGNLRLASDERVTVRDLLFASLTGSANNAAFALPRALGMSDEAFLQEMNRKAITFGLESVRFVDAAGLSPENIGSAYDVARLAAHALAQYPLIAEAMAAPTYRVVAQGSGREHIIRNSNPLLSELAYRAESKTGYLDEALHCLVLTKVQETGRIIAVLLGHPDEFGVTREADALLDTISVPGTRGSHTRE